MPEAKYTHNTLQPYLIVRNCAAALEFYGKAFGATERTRMDRSGGRVGHAEIQIGSATLMMADEHPEVGAFSPEHYGGSPVSFHFSVEDCDAAFERAIAAGAETARVPQDQPYGERNAAVLDPFGYKWWIGAALKTKPKKTSEGADGVHVDCR